MHGPVRNTQTETCLRVASLAIAFYDYILTLPAEWRFYRSQRSVLQPSVACILFILIRYTSILALTISNYGFFATDFTPDSCRHFFWAAPILKVVQTMVSQAILAVRTVNISRRTPWVKWIIIMLFITFTTLEWFTNLFQRNPVMDHVGDCIYILTFQLVDIFWYIGQLHDWQQHHTSICVVVLRAVHGV